MERIKVRKQGVWTKKDLHILDLEKVVLFKNSHKELKLWTANENKGCWPIQQNGNVLCQFQEIFGSESFSLEKF